GSSPRTLSGTMWECVQGQAADALGVTEKRASPRRRGALPGRDGRSRDGVVAVGRDQRVDDRIELAVQHARDLVDLEADPMIGDPVLGEVVGPDLLRPLAGPDLAATRVGELLGLLAHLEVVEARPQDRHRLGAVLELRALVLALDDDAGREVRQPDGALDLVDVLPAGA